MLWRMISLVAQVYAKGQIRPMLLDCVVDVLKTSSNNIRIEASS